MKRLKYTIANWKMNGTRNSLNLVNSIKKYLNKTGHKDSKVIICPPFTLLSQLIKFNKKLSYGGQDCHHFDDGAFTGSISAKMLKDIGCKYVIIGHSERREYQKEGIDEIKSKINSALKNNLIVIFCIGEKLSQIKKRTSVLQSQIKSLPNQFDVKKIIVAYEPVWAIGTGKVPLANEINNIHLKIRNLISKKIGTANSNKISILYGGSVNAKNAREILNLSHVDGVLVGGASLKFKEFSKIIDSY